MELCLDVSLPNNACGSNGEREEFVAVDAVGLEDDFFGGGLDAYTVSNRAKKNYTKEGFSTCLGLRIVLSLVLPPRNRPPLIGID